MIFVYGLLFLLGLFLFVLAFTLTAFQAFVFAAGILAISLALALPIHFSRR